MRRPVFSISAGAVFCKHVRLQQILPRQRLPLQNMLDAALQLSSIDKRAVPIPHLQRRRQSRQRKAHVVRRPWLMSVSTLGASSSHQASISRARSSPRAAVWFCASSDRISCVRAIASSVNRFTAICSTALSRPSSSSVTAMVMIFLRMLPPHLPRLNRVKRQQPPFAALFPARAGFPAYPASRSARPCPAQRRDPVKSAAATPAQAPQCACSVPASARRESASAESVINRRQMHFPARRRSFYPPMGTRSASRSSPGRRSRPRPSR